MKIQKRPEDKVVQAKPLEAFLAGVLSPSTRRAYRKDLEQFFRFVGWRSPLDITPTDGVAFRNWLLEKGYAKSSINRKLSALRSAFDYLVALGVLRLNPFHPKLVRGFKAPRQFSPATLTREEIRTLLAACEKNRGPFGRLIGLRDKIIILLGLVELLRRSEVASLRVGDVKQRGGFWVLRLRRTKSGSAQFVKLRSDIKALIDEYLSWIERARERPFGEEDPLLHSFSNRNFLGPLSDSAVDKIFRRRCRLAGIDLKRREISFHSLRHTGITLAKEAGADITLVQLAARHSDPKTTMRYYHSDEWLKNSAVDRINW